MTMCASCSHSGPLTTPTPLLKPRSRLSINANAPAWTMRVFRIAVARIVASCDQNDTASRNAPQRTDFRTRRTCASCGADANSYAQVLRFAGAAMAETFPELVIRSFSDLADAFRTIQNHRQISTKHSNNAPAPAPVSSTNTSAERGPRKIQRLASIC